MFKVVVSLVVMRVMFLSGLIDGELVSVGVWCGRGEVVSVGVRG